MLDVHFALMTNSLSNSLALVRCYITGVLQLFRAHHFLFLKLYCMPDSKCVQPLFSDLCFWFQFQVWRGKSYCSCVGYAHKQKSTFLWLLVCNAYMWAVTLSSSYLALKLKVATVKENGARHSLLGAWNLVVSCSLNIWSWLTKSPVIQWACSGCNFLLDFSHCV